MSSLSTGSPPQCQLFGTHELEGNTLNCTGAAPLCHRGPALRIISPTTSTIVRSDLAAQPCQLCAHDRTRDRSCADAGMLLYEYVDTYTQHNLTPFTNAQLQSTNETCKSLLDRVGSLRDER